MIRRTMDPAATPQISNDKKYLWFLFLLVFPLYMTWTFDHSLWNPDETRDAGIAREMWVSKDFVTPRLNGETFLEKPPLYYWTTSLVYATTGKITDGLTRLPAALYGFLGILFVFLLGRRLIDARTGLMAAGILATVGQYFRMSHFALMDSSLAALLTGAFYFYVAGNVFLFLLFTILAFYTKGFVAIALAGVVIGSDLIMKKQGKRLVFIIVAGAGLFAVAVGPWIYSLWKAGGSEYLRIFFVENNWDRFFSGKVDHAAPFYFYLGSFPVDFLPWTFVFIPAVVSSFRRKPHSSTRFVSIWFVAMFVLLSLASGKRSMYLLPLFPAAALMCAEWLRNRQSGWKIFLWLSIGTSVTLLAADVLYVKKLDRDKTFLPVVQAIQEYRGQAQVIGFDMSEMERGVLPFYLQQNIRNIPDVSDLQAYLKANAGHPVLLVTNRNKLTDAGSQGLAPLLEGQMEKVYAYRADKKTRSYLLYKKS